MIKRLLIALFIVLTITPAGIGQELTAKEIITEADQLIRGNSSYAEMEMKIIRPKWERTLKFKSWAKGTDYSVVYITYPVKEKGQVFLKREREMWNYIPAIERMIKIPPSMMMQSWMGSDLTNDDLVNASSIVKDYEHKIVGTETKSDYECWIIELIPKEDAPVVWGKIKTWITKKGYMTLRNEYYDEDQYLVNEETLSQIKNVGDRVMPTRYEIIPVDKPGQKTTLVFTHIKFEVPIKDSFFSIQNIRRVK
ncbi:outer membrane lipoprotein-sorting protein [Marinilabiliaceae bacterium JC017]|nr:outer membrane lipoprotein-sorting protein [Marinilabiliaceae bacterium JC017]